MRSPPTCRQRSASVSMVATTRSLAEALRAPSSSAPARRTAVSLEPRRMDNLLSEGVSAVGAHRVLDLQEPDGGGDHARTTQLLRVEAQARELAGREGDRGGAAVAPRHV